MSANNFELLLKQQYGEKASAQSWPEPEKLNDALLPVENLPKEIIPHALRSWVSDIAFRMQCPLDFPANSAMVMTSSIIGAGCGIRPKRLDDWLVIPNLWGAVIGRPGSMKTPALSEVLKPLQYLEGDAKKQFDDEQVYFEAEKESKKAYREAIKADMLNSAKGKGTKGMTELKQDYMSLPQPELPKWRRYKTNDSTIEKLAILLEENPRGILLFRDELIGLLASWEKQGRESDRAFFLEAWNGYGNHTADRIGRETVFCANMCVSILGGIQPAKLMAYLSQAMSDMANDGLLQRMQMTVYPDELPAWRLIDEYPDKNAQHRAFECIKTLASMDFKQAGAQDDEIPYFQFDVQAQELFYEWIIQLQAKIQADESPALLEHLNKYRSLMPSLALIDHLTQVAEGRASGQVGLNSAELAAGWCDYLESHARRIYSLGSTSRRPAIELAKKLSTGRLGKEFKPWDVYHNGWHLLDTRETVEKACDELIDAYWLRAVIAPRGEQVGRPEGVKYLVNPAILPSDA